MPRKHDKGKGRYAPKTRAQRAAFDAENLAGTPHPNTGFESMPGSSGAIGTPQSPLLLVDQVGTLSGEGSSDDSNDLTVVEKRTSTETDQGGSGSRNGAAILNNDGSVLRRNESNALSGLGENMNARCFSDFRRRLRVIRREMFDAPPDHWRITREEFYVRLADMEHELQNEVFPHIQELRDAGCPGKADSVDVTAKEFRSVVLDLQALTDRECGPGVQQSESGRLNNKPTGVVRTREQENRMSTPVPESNQQAPYNGRTGSFSYRGQDSRGHASGARFVEPPARIGPGPGNRSEYFRQNDGSRRQCDARVERAMEDGIYRTHRDEGNHDRYRPSHHQRNGSTGPQHGWHNGDVRQGRGPCGNSLLGAVGASHDRNSYRQDHNAEFDQHRSTNSFSFQAPGRGGGPRSLCREGSQNNRTPWNEGLGSNRPHQSGHAPNFVYEEGESFYWALPAPWNVLPRISSVSQSDYMRMSFGHTFSGKLEEYETFRALFIPIKHAVDVPIALKHYALSSCLTSSALELVQGTLPTCEGYSLLISRLEEAYGGTFRQLDRGMAKIRKLKEVHHGQCQELEALVRAVDAYAASLGPRAGELYAHGNFIAIEEKISVEMRKDYRVWCSMMDRDGDHLDNLMDWLRNVQLPPLRRESDRDLVRRGDRSGRVHLSDATKDCPICVGSEKHALTRCQPFLDMPVEKRRSLVALLKRCFRCLAAEHISRDCPTSTKCKTCDRNHHELLHTDLYVRGKNRSNFTECFDEDDPSLEGLPAQEYRAKPTMVTKPDAQESSECSLRFSAGRVYCPGEEKFLEENILCDDGSNITLIDEEIAAELGLKGERIQTKITGVGGRVETYSAMYTEIEVVSLNGNVRRRVKAKVIPNPTGNLVATNWNNLRASWPHLRSVPFPSPVGDGRCRMIIGTDQAYLLRSLEEIPGGTSFEPIARRTPLGWTCVGPIKPPQTGERAFLSFRSRAILEEPEILDRALDQPTLCLAADRLALKMILEQSCLVDGRVQVPVLWRDPVVRPKNNYFQALQRWRSLLKFLERTPEKLNQYHAVITGWEAKGYVRPVPQEDVGKSDVYFLPHFPVCRSDKPSTKLRIVMDGKSEYQGLSLNKCVLPGPKVINSLFDVLVRFRRFPVALIGDAKEMFLRLRLSPKDRSYHRFVYTPPGSVGPVEYENLSHVFGNCGSLTNAVTTVKLQALKEEDSFPLAAETVLRGSMVDDNLASVMTTEEGVEVVKGLKSIYSNVGMDIHKWSSSHPQVLANVPSEDLADIVELGDLDEEGQATPHKALGIVWSTKEDVFSYSYSLAAPDFPTQRKLLKRYMAIFDPLGWICPFVMLARLLYRDTCSLKLGWDNLIPSDLELKWRKWFSQLAGLSGLHIPRWLCSERGQPGVLHIFSDASHDAYGACAYWAAGPMEASSSRRLIASKAKVNSSDARSIPQLELLGAMVGLGLAKSLCRALDCDLQGVYFWVDAENTLRRVLTPAKGMERFVARRVALLREETNLQNWRWVGTDENPADIVSRGVKVERLLASNLWWNGPGFLRSKSSWPTLKFMPHPYVELQEEQDMLRLIGIFQSSQGKEDVWERHSCFGKCIRIMRLVLLFIHKLGKRGVGFPATHSGARLGLFRWEQSKNWTYEISVLSSGMNLPSKHPWNRFDYSISQGLVQVQTRTKDRPLVLLPSNSYLTRLWLRHVHERELLHVGGHRSLMVEIRRISWVLRGLAECKGIVWNCVTCKRREPCALRQRMAPLPKFRLEPKDKLPVAFATAGLDVAGPFETKQGRGKTRLKRYMLLICCTVFRAVHIEMLYGLETSDILLALQRFACRRGVPVELVSDNGTYFTRAAKEIAQGGALSSTCVSSAWGMVSWKFNPPQAPHTGGMFESLIKSAKRALLAVLGTASLRDEDLLSAFVFIEGVLNARPLDFVSTDSTDLEPITPAHFLSGPRVQESAFKDLEKGTAFSKRWRSLNKVREHFWVRFLKEVRPGMGLRAKWRKEITPLAAGDVVVVLTDKNDQGRWPLAIITEALAGKDGLIRVVKIRMKGKEFTRHVNYLMPLL